METTEDPPKPPLLGVIGLMLGIFLSALDGQIIGTALPTIVGDLGGLEHLSWAVTAYLLTSAAATPFWGRLGDLYGRKGAYQWAVVLFLAGSMLSGLAQDMGELIAFRALQGVGAGGLMVGALSVIGVLVPASDRGRVQSVIGVLMPIAFVGGPLLGGFLTDRLSWRWAFYVNLPVGLLALLAVGVGVRLRTERVRAPFDWAGVALLTTGILALTLVSSWGGTEYAWTSPWILGTAVVAAGALGWFVRTELRAPGPLIPPALFRDRNFSVAQVLGFLAGAVMLALVGYLPQYLQFVQGASPTVGGLLLLPLMLGMMGTQLVTARLMSRPGGERRYPLLGGTLALVGAALLLLLGADTPIALASALTAVAGIGLGLLMQSTLLTSMGAVPRQDMGAAMGVVTLLRSIGGSLGMAALGAVYTARLTDGLTAHLGPEESARLTGGGGLTPASLTGLPPAVRDAVGEAVTSGLHGTLLGGAALAALATAVACLARPAQGAVAEGAQVKETVG
ncbi:MDR family MFS transporter [Kitasatospora brasiliensis]|uniref:MDR family MFS transporter n=1 Tax=Kitasatospora brasiliensis TaxID=3058040 RepID=UPI00293007FB|nr:MDR family MFS transporter [Kitasatospora sp. K002]